MNVKEEKIENNLIKYIRDKRPSLVNEEDFIQNPSLAIGKIIKTLDKEITEITKSSYTYCLKSDWQIKRLDIMHAIKVQDIVWEIEVYLLSIDEKAEETPLYKEVEKLDNKCILLFKILEPSI